MLNSLKYISISSAFASRAITDVFSFDPLEQFETTDVLMFESVHIINNSSIIFAMFFLAEYGNMLMTPLINVELFFALLPACSATAYKRKFKEKHPFFPGAVVTFLRFWLPHPRFHHATNQKYS